MTQLDLPPVSFARYLDLLKRRTWQVIPITLLGLLIGGLVAFFIPRYYVATTIIRFNGNVADPRGGDAEDPLMGELESAKNTIPAMVPETLRSMGWPEITSSTDDARLGFENAVRSRVDVVDLTGARRGRTSMQLQISYRDTDQRRAQSFTRKLRDMWVESEKNRVMDLIGRSQADINQRLRRTNASLDNAQYELRLFDELNNINPEDFQSGRDNELSVLTTTLNERSRALEQLEDQLRNVDQQIESLQQQLDTTPPMIPKARTESMPSIRQMELEALLQLLRVAQMRKDALGPSHPNKAASVHTYEVLRRQYEELLAETPEAVAAAEVPNPQHEALRRQRQAALADQGRLREAVRVLAERVARLAEERQARPRLYADRAEKVRSLEAIERQLVDLQRDRDQLETKLNRLSFEKPYDIMVDAHLPPAPTEPNITLVALTGCLVGLGAAIGLVLLLDMLRSTFKTVDDVSRGLPVPVLGSISHMETVEHRFEVRRRRRFATILTAAFVVLVVALVVLYYTDPTSLPAAVVRVLDVLLGAPAPK